MQLKNLSVASIAGIMPRSQPVVSPGVRLPLNESLLTGIEVEGELASINDHAVLAAAGWAVHEDGSLRDDGLEFVLDRPSAGNALSSAVEGFFSAVRNDQVEYQQSPRSGTHIHVNVSDQAYGVAQNMLAIMYCIDELVFKWADDDRAWCSYCNSLNTLPARVLRAALVEREVNEHFNRHYVWPVPTSDRYYGFNFSSIFKHGTVEFRYFPTTKDEQQMWSWIDFTHAVFNAASGCYEKDLLAADILQAAADAPAEFLNNLLRDVPSVLAQLITVEGWSNSIASAASELLEMCAVEDADAGGRADANTANLGFVPSGIGGYFDELLTSAAAPSTGRVSRNYLSQSFDARQITAITMGESY